MNFFIGQKIFIWRPNKRFLNKIFQFINIFQKIVQCVDMCGMTQNENTDNYNCIFEACPHTNFMAKRSL